MTKHAKKHLLLSMVLFSLLLISCVYLSFIPSAYAKESNSQEEVLSILNNVVDVDLAVYETNLEESKQDFYLSVLPQERLKYTLKSDEHTLDVECKFVNKKLRVIRIRDLNESSTKVVPIANVPEKAKDFLSRYENYSGVSLFTDLKSILDTVDATENVTKATNDVILKVIVTQDYSNFRWTYAVNGVPAPSKCITLNYENGFLNYFIDHWSVYNIGSTEINISEEKAIETAMEETNDYSWKVGTGNNTWIEVKEFEISKVISTELVFGNEIPEKDARDGDFLTLYPLWDIKLRLDKVYPGNVYGINVRIWADTKEVFQVKTLSYLGASQSDENLIDAKSNTSQSSEDIFEVNSTQLLILLTAIPFLLAIALKIKKVRFSRKVVSFRFTSFQKLRLLQVGVLFYLLISLTMTLQPVPLAKAEDLPQSTGKTLAYGIRKYVEENDQTAANNLCDYIVDNSVEEGYVAENYYGEETIGVNILNNAADSEENFHRVSIFHYGHGYGDDIEDEFHSSYMGNDWIPVWDHEIYDKTGLDKHFFVFLWVCMQGVRPSECFYHEGVGAVGMPLAWHNTMGLSDEGYGYPDESKYCFIGFDSVSPTITNQATAAPSGVTCADFLYEFYDNTLNDHQSVNDALFEASTDLFTCDFKQCDLYTGELWVYYDFSFLGEGMEGDFPVFMRVYGNGDIHLNQHNFVVSVNDQYNNNYPNKDVYIDLPSNIANTGTTIKVTEGYHVIYVNDFWEPGYTGYRYTFDYYQGTTWQEEVQTATMDFDEDLTVSAHFTKEYCPGDVDGDGDADQTDWDTFLISYPSSRGDHTYSYDSRCDFNSDGDIDVEDQDYLHDIIFVQQYRLTISAGAGGTTNPSPDDYYYDPDTAVQVTAINYTNYVFDHWNLDGEYYSDNSTVTVTMYSDYTLHAVFEGTSQPIPVTIVVDATAVGDNYARYHALTVDNPIPRIFWEGEWYNLNHGATKVAAGSVHYDKTFYLTEGYHNIEYAVSCFVGYWHATITVGGQVVAEQDTEVNNHVTAQINVGGGPPPPQYRLTISAGSGGTTSPQPGDHWYPAGTPVQVTADPDGGYNLHYWLLDTEYYSNNLTVTVTMDSHHTLQAIFNQGLYDVSTGSVYLYNGQYHQFEVPFKIDGEVVGPTWYTYQVTEGPHTFEVPYVAWAGPGVAIVFDYWVVNGWPYSSDNPIGFPIHGDGFLGAVYKVEYW
jgi:hypothetical protein